MLILFVQHYFNTGIHDLLWILYKTRLKSIPDLVWILYKTRLKSIQDLVWILYKTH